MSDLTPNTPDYTAEVWDKEKGKYVKGELCGFARELAEREDSLSEQEKRLLDLARRGTGRYPEGLKEKKEAS